MGEGVRLFLENLGMLKYFDIFCARGFDLESDIPHINLFDLENSLMIESKSDRAIIYANAQNYKPSKEYNLFEWLLKHSLDHYYINFIQSELTDLNVVARIQLPNENLYDELEIVLPGHKKRLERAVASLRQEGIGHDVPAEIPVTQGWWGKPKCLPQAKFDFLCVSANLCASQQPENKVNIDFMVDSGSDVSTVQEKTLENLNLELIGPVYSCGIHGGNYTNLYKAQLEVGNEKLDIEVLASNYDSLGSRIVRHFRHVIDGKKHIWLKGNYKDPIPAILPTLSLDKFSSDASASLTNTTETLSPTTKLSLPSPTSVPSASSTASEITSLGYSPERNNTNIQKDTLQTAVTPTQDESGVQSSLESAALEHLENGAKSQSCQSLYQSESSIQKTATSNSFIPLLSTNSKNQIRIHSQNNLKNRHDNGRSNNSTTSNVHIFESSVRTFDVRDEPSSCHSSQKTIGGVRDEENDIRYKKEENSELCSFDENKLQLQDTSVDFKSAGQKRQSVSFLNSFFSPKKVPKIDNVDSGIIPPTLKDTDDDIDNINPFIMKDIHHSNNHQWATRFSDSHNKVHRQLRNLRHRESLVRGDAMDSTNDKEVVHVLSHSDDEGVLHLHDDEQYDKSLETMRQNSNFMPGVGTSVIIPVDDLEENEFLCPTKDISNNCE